MNYYPRKKYFYEDFYYSKLKREQRKHLRRRNDILNSTGEDIGEFTPPEIYRHIEKISYTNWLLRRTERLCNRVCNDSFNEGKFSQSGSDIFDLTKIMRYDCGEYAVNGIRMSYKYITDTLYIYIGDILIYTITLAEAEDTSIQWRDIWWD
ncbi:hypothetical protein TSAR_009612 [Trichomalopsis sarcophagae]|uniref:Uncharacterized protein n=1 Tax=Trichomalopsis sarcophagae TaxID=543379 RepID=A0A232F0M2_9HYME|nr:hypothetical protein TSAR_009612 [Trichomalopsis sarcophagae]